MQLILVPGDDRPDPELSDLSTVAAEDRDRLWQFLRQGGMGNALDFFRCLASRWLGRDYAWAEPQTLPRTAIYHPHKSPAALSDWQADWQRRSTGGGGAVLPLAFAGGEHRVSSMCSASACRRRG